MNSVQQSIEHINMLKWQVGNKGTHCFCSPTKQLSFLYAHANGHMETKSWGQQPLAPIYETVKRSAIIIQVAPIISTTLY